MTGLKVVGAGFGRTGTMTLKRALDRLGYHTYHMEVVIEKEQHHLGLWQAIADASSTSETHKLLHQCFENYTAAVDFPAAAWWREIVDAFPGVRVILSVRDDAEKWYASASTTIIPFAHSWQMTVIKLVSPFHRDLAPLVGRIWAKAFDTPGFDPYTRSKDEVIEGYLRWNNQVRSSAPRGRFLEWHTGSSGWKDLCEFLQVPSDKCPVNEPFPHSNSRAAFFLQFLLPITTMILSPFLVVAGIVLLIVVRKARRGQHKQRTADPREQASGSKAASQLSDGGKKTK